jgi:hypothetical protein
MSLAPELRKRVVATDKLLLDPNNPRLFTTEQEKVPLADVPNPGVQERARAELRSDRFHIDELIESIKTNKYVPEAGGYIFVRSVPGTDFFLVLEGNRRLVSLRELLILERELDEAVLDSILNIEVLEIIDEIPEEEIQEKISYLLGTCHHGSHKDWSPFAQARGIYERYLERTGQTDDSFEYRRDDGASVANLLSIKEKEVEERLKVYRAMRQLSEHEKIQAMPRGGIISRYYSLIAAAVSNPPSHLQQYLQRDPDTFYLEPDAMERMINLCNFDGTTFRYRNNSEGQLIRGGDGRPVAPPMKNPKQWGFLNKILEDPDVEARTENLRLVEQEYEFPEDVWARRRAEMTDMTWKRWLEEVKGILSSVRMEDDFDSPEAREAVERLHLVVASINETA